MYSPTARSRRVRTGVDVIAARRTRARFLHPIAITLVLAVLATTTVLVPLAGTARAQGVNLIDVAVQGQTITDVQLIKNVAGLVPGSFITQENIQQAIHQVYGLDIFKNVRILGEEVEGGVRLTIEVEELPRLDKLVFEGNKKLKEKDFGLDLKRGLTIGPNRLKEAEQVIRRAYQKKGFFLVDVEAELKPTAIVGETDVVFRIEENNPVKIEAVEFVGNDRVEAGKLRKKMSNKPRGFFTSLFGGRKFDRAKYADDKIAITDHYREKGFLDAMIVSDTIILNEEKTRVTLRLEVTEGPRYYFGTTEFDGDSVLPEERLHSLLRYSEGDVFDQREFDESIGQMYEAYMEEGYLYSRIVEDTRTTDTTVDITMEISEGVPAHVHRIDITGNAKTKDKVIRRELAIFPGQIFRRSALQRSLRNVMLLNYFGNVVPDFRQLPDGRVNLDFKVEEKPTGQIQVGGGYSEQDKLVGTINLGVPNLFGNGQSANLLLEFGSRRHSYSLGFTEPWFMDTPTTVGFDIQKLDRVWDDPYVSGTEDFHQRTNGITLRLGRRLRWPDDYFTVYWNYRWEDQEFTEFSDEFDEAGRQALIASANGIISSTAFTVLRDSRNLPEFATAGSRASYRAEFGGGLLGGEWTFTKHTFNYAFFKKLWKVFTLAPQWTLGTIEGGTGPTSIPYSELFYAGGIRSDGMIRGYDDRSIVAFADTSLEAPPRWYVPSGEPIDTLRGQAMMVMNAQITFPIVPQQIHGLLFFDAGNVWLNATEMRPFTDVFTSYGFGFRLS
ncbi:MAG TPA: outer membrane protein assembly factor BamA, partial [Acidobacteriota bacterium]|nr:outer membrane protein assembly factor BamA [Acidobacteriota bacterium]